MAARNRQPAPDTLSALFDVFVLAQAVHELLTDAFAGSPLSPEEYAVYSAILERPGSTPSELAEQLASPLTTVSDWVRTLDRRGHVAREVRPADRRSYAISLTEAGRAAQRATNRRFETVNAAFIAALPWPEAKLRNSLGSAVEAVARAHQALDESARDFAS